MIMSIFRKDESRAVSIAWEAAAWICLVLFGLTIAKIIGLWVG